MNPNTLAVISKDTWVRSAVPGDGKTYFWMMAWHPASGTYWQVCVRIDGRNTQQLHRFAKDAVRARVKSEGLQ